MTTRSLVVLILNILVLLAVALIVLGQRQSPVDYASAQAGAVVAGPQNASGSSGKASVVNDGEVLDYGPNAGYAWAYLDKPLTVTLAKTQTINKVEILFLDIDSRSFQYRLEVSPDGETFQTIADCAQQPRRGWQTHVFEARPAKVVRVIVTDTTVEARSYHVVEVAAWNQSNPEEPSPLRRKFDERSAFLEAQRRTRAEVLDLRQAVTAVFGNQNALRRAREMGDGETSKLDVDNDGGPDLIVWREGRNVIAGLDEDHDLRPTDTRPDNDNDCWAVDYGGDGELDRVVDYVDNDRDGDADASVLYLLTSNVWSRRDMTCVVIADADDDNKMWHLLNYEYRQEACQWDCDFDGNEFFSMGRYDDGQRRWVSWLENPFCFYDLDGDGDSEVALRFSGTDLALRSLRYSFDIDNDATPNSPKDYGFSITALGNVQCPDELATTFALRGGGKLTYVSWEHGREVAEWAPWSRAELCWDENDNNVNPHGSERFHERWEGVIAHGSKHFPQEGGPSCGPLNKRYEVDRDFSGRLGLYYCATDHRLHLRGAECGWLDADYDNDGRTDLRFRYEDNDGNGFFDTWRVDADADGKDEWSATMPDEQLRLVSWDYRGMHRVFVEGLASAKAAQQRRLKELKKRKDAHEFEVERYWNAGMPGFYAAEKVRSSAEGTRYYRDLVVAKLAADLGAPVFVGDLQASAPGVSVALNLTNPLPLDRAADPVVIPLTSLPEIRAALTPGHPFVAVRDGQHLRAAQADDLDGDGIYDEIVFQTDLRARESRTIALVTNPPHPPAVEKRTATNLYMGLSLGWESNLIAYRTYYGKLDVFGKKSNLLKLRDLKGAYHREADWGMDILHIGPAAGVGGLYLWAGETAIPGMNEANQPESVRITKQVLVDGPLRSIVQANLAGLRTPRGTFHVIRRFSVYADGQHVEEQLTITGGDGGHILYGPGLIRIEGEQFGQGKNGLTYVWNWGKQHHPDVADAGEIGLALLASTANVVDVRATERDHVLRCRTRSGVSQRQYLVADWAKGKRHVSAESWRTFVAALAQRVAAPVKWTRARGQQH